MSHNADVHKLQRRDLSMILLIVESKHPVRLPKLPFLCDPPSTPLETSTAVNELNTLKFLEVIVKTRSVFYVMTATTLAYIGAVNAGEPHHSLIGGQAVAQAAVQPAIPTERLHESFNRESTKRNMPLRIESNGCMKDRKYLGSTNCYFTLMPKTSIEVSSDRADGPPKIIKLEMPGGKDNEVQVLRTAGLLAIVLMPDLPESDMRNLVKRIREDAAGTWGEAVITSGSFEFRYQLQDDKITLEISNRRPS